MRKSILLSVGVLLLCFLGLFTSCEIGMGNSLDLEAPVITITSPEKLSYQKLDFTMTGTCYDNIEVTSVVIANAEPETSPLYKVYAYATIDGENWTADLHIPKEEEGDITFKCTATDKSGNSSSRSFKQIELFIDETSPEGLAWYIDKGNHKQIALMDLEDIKALNFNNSVNKDIPQNDDFTVYAKMYDAMSIEHIKLFLSDEDGNVISSLTKEVTELTYANTSQSIYNPSFSFKKSDFSDYSTGKHYFKLSYWSKDKSGNESVRDLLWMLWYPESDLPGIEIGTDNDVYDNNSLRITVNNSISTNFFDDDALKEVKWAIRKPSNVNYTAEQLIKNSSTRDAAFSSVKQDYELVGSKIFDISGSSGYTTDYLVPGNDVQAPSIPMELKFIVCALDSKNNWNAKIIDLIVDDNAKPLLFIDTPIENTIPKIKDGEKSIFQISGYSLDSKGSKNIKIVFIPNSSAYNTAAKKEALAKEILKKDSKDSGHDILENGAIIWRQVLPKAGQAGYNDQTADGWVEQKFSFDFDMINDSDIGFNGAAGRDDKFFELMLVDTDNNQVFRQFKTVGDTTVPSIEYLYPEKNMSIVDYSTQDLIIRYKGSKDTGLGMIEPKYKLTFEGKEYTIANGGLKAYTKPNADPSKIVPNDSVEFIIPKAQVKEIAETKNNTQPTFYLTSFDLLENEVTEPLTLILSPLPHITGISSDKPESTYKKGDSITLQVNFSGNVRVSGTPKLKLFLTKDDRTNNRNVKYASYIRGSETNSLTFEYIVEDGDVSANGLECLYEDPIFLNNGSITTAELGEGNAHINVIETGKNLQDSKKLKVDGEAPVINSIVFKANVAANSDTNYYVSNSKTITATLTASEPILISGTPTLNVKSGTNTIAFNFQSISDKTITFVHKVSSLSSEGRISYNPSKYFSTTDLNMMIDEAGNKLKLKTGSDINANVVIDKTNPTRAPAISVAAGSYNKAQDLTLTGFEEGATVEYSIDGGVSWTKYTDTVKIQVGTHNITTRQYDKAGNVSPTLTPVKIVINDTFPLPSGFTIKKPDGKYKKGEVVTMFMDFEETVFAPNAGDVKITMTPYGKITPAKVLSSKPVAASGSTKVEFEYTVTETDNFNGVQISNPVYTASFVDEYGNNPTPAKTTAALNTLFADTNGGARQNLTLDGKAPSVVSYSPVNNGINTSENDAFTITVTFDEPVYSESGSVILQRKGNWAIPAVLTGAQFHEVYDNAVLTTAQKETLMATENGNGSGNERLDSRTGIAVGPYRCITHGLKTSGTEIVPDEEIKYVLAFDLGLYEGSTKLDKYAADGGKTISVADIRSAFEATGYHQHKVDIRSKKISIVDNVMTIEMPEVIEDGIEWELIIPEGALRDATGNSFAGIKSGDYTVWSNNVSTPVVRVDRYSHGYGAALPDSTGAIKSEITGYALPEWAGNLKGTGSLSTRNTGVTIAPTGYARVRIDSQTPGADIYYKVVNKSSVAVSANSGATRYRFKDNTDSVPTTTVSTNSGVKFTADNSNLDFTITRIGNATPADLKLESGGTKYSAIFAVGDGKSDTARKDYVTAYASKSGFKTSGNGYEGVFKTVIYAYPNGNQKLNFEGGTAKGGESKVNGFPLKDAPSDYRFSKNGYKNSDDSYIWVSYEIITSNNAFLLHRSNYSTNYPYFSYGQMTYTNKFKCWD